MRFHYQHGDHIVLEEDQTKATRCQGFCNGVVFSREPVTLNEYCVVTVTGSEIQWSGSLSIGMTNHDPDTMTAIPTYVSPYLVRKQTGFWAAFISDDHLKRHRRLTFYVNKDGEMRFVADDQHEELVLQQLPTTTDRLWLMIDVYGGTTSVKFNQEHDVPLEVYSKGPEAVHDFNMTLHDASVSTYRTRLMLIGSDQSARSILKRGLIDKHDATTKTTTTIDDLLQVSGYHWMDLDEPADDSVGVGVVQWDGELVDDTVTSSPSIIDATFYEMLASNISRSVSLESKSSKMDGVRAQPEVRKKFKSAKANERPAAGTRRTPGGGGGGGGGAGATNGIQGSRKRNAAQGGGGGQAAMSDLKEDRFGQYLLELPDDVSASVRIMLQDTESKQLLDMESNEKVVTSTSPGDLCRSMSGAGIGQPLNIAYHVWDVSIQRLHQDLLPLLLSPRAIYIIVFDLDTSLDDPWPPVLDKENTTNSANEEPTAAAAAVPTCQLDDMLFWMNCIHAYATPSVVPRDDNATAGFLSPPILIVGTYRRMPDHEDGADHEKKIEEKFLRIQDSVLNKAFCDHVIRPFFALDISEPPEAEDPVDRSDHHYNNNNISSNDDNNNDQNNNTNNNENDNTNNQNNTTNNQTNNMNNQNNNKESQNEIIGQLRKKIRDIVASQPSYGEEMSMKWLRFETTVLKLKGNGFYYVDLDLIQEIARNEGIESDSSQRSLLSFYHDVGLLMHFGEVVGSQDWSLTQWVILDPLWMISAFNTVLTFKGSTEERVEAWHHQDGILTSDIIQEAFATIKDHKAILLEAMIKLDLIVQKHNYLRRLDEPGDLIEKFYVPSMTTSPTPLHHQGADPVHGVTLYYDFMGFLPDALFHRLIVRTIQWTQSFEGRDPILHRRSAAFYLDRDFDFMLTIQRSGAAWMKITIAMNKCAATSPLNEQMIPPFACAKVRNFVESTLADLREVQMKRMSYRTCVCCPCDRACAAHMLKECQNEACKHYLLLDDCLANNVVLCDYRRVNTSFIRKRFPRTTISGYNVPVLPESVVMRTVNNETIIMDGMGLVLYQRPTASDNAELNPKVASGFRTLAKILNGAGEGHDWEALAHSLGYRQTKVDEFREDLNPGLALLADWILSSGNTCLSVDMLMSCLKQMDSHQAIDILREMQDEREETPVFVSYQWDAQDDVVLIVNKLEQHGLDCWIDIGQMGGGDLLYNRIYRAISRAKVILTCITPKFVVSNNCTREVSLADLLGKPVIPVMIYPTTWPPPGPLALLFSQSVYIDMCGIGGHGGTGYHADWDDRFQEILAQIGKYVTPVYRKMLPPSAARSARTTTTTAISTSMATAMTTTSMAMDVSSNSRVASSQNFITIDTTSFRDGMMDRGFGLHGQQPSSSTSASMSMSMGMDTLRVGRPMDMAAGRLSPSDDRLIAEEYRLMVAAAAQAVATATAQEDMDNVTGAAAATVVAVDEQMDNDMLGSDDLDSLPTGGSGLHTVQSGQVVKCSVCLIL